MDEGSNGFNPTLVRLRPVGRHSLGDVSLPFQSHAGSIEAAGGDMIIFVTEKGFNPTLVRLRRG